MRNDRGMLISREFMFDEPYTYGRYCYEYDCDVCYHKRSLSEARTAAIITVWAYLRSVTIVRPYGP